MQTLVCTEMKASCVAAVFTVIFLLPHIPKRLQLTFIFTLQFFLVSSYVAFFPSTSVINFSSEDFHLVLHRHELNHHEPPDTLTQQIMYKEIL